MSTVKKHLFGGSIHAGLLVLRIGMGFQMLLHGWPKISGGMEKWEKLGAKMSLIGIDFAPTFWGFMAAFAEFGGGVLILLGWFTRPSSFLLAFTMLVAAIYHWSEEGAGFMDASHALELFMVFVALYITGPGKYSLDEKFHRI
jgi:putative oxidoreductase